MKNLLFVILIFPFYCWSQNIRDTTIYTPIFNISYAFQMPGADLAKSFGLNNNIGFSGGFKNAKNFQFEIGGTFFFSPNVKDTAMLDPLQTVDGNIINAVGEYNSFLIFERGFTGTLSVGKVLPIIGPNPNSGILIKFGIGGMRHKVRIENQQNGIPQLSKPKLVYYDRLTFGMVCQQYIGYQHLSNSRLTNFNIGLEIFEGFTQGMRDYQIDLMGPYKDKRLDLLMGIRIGWVIPVYKKAPNEFYVN